MKIPTLPPEALKQIADTFKLLNSLPSVKITIPAIENNWMERLT